MWCVNSACASCGLYVSDACVACVLRVWGVSQVYEWCMNGAHALNVLAVHMRHVSSLWMAHVPPWFSVKVEHVHHESSEWVMHVHHESNMRVVHVSKVWVLCVQQNSYRTGTACQWYMCDVCRRHACRMWSLYGWPLCSLWVAHV